MNGDPKEGKARRLDVGFAQNVGPQMNLFVFVVIPVSLQKYHKRKFKRKTAGTFSRHLEVALAARTMKRAAY